MAQQYPQQPYQAQTQLGQQLQQQPFSQMIGQRFQESVPQEVQSAAMDLDRLESVCEWMKSQAAERGRVRIAQRADDIANIAHLEKKLLLRQSPFAEPIGRATQQTVQQGIQEFQQHVSEPEVQEALTQAQQSLTSINQALGRVQQWGQEISTTPEMTQPQGVSQPQGVTPQQGVTQPPGVGQPQY
jgi:hypothetical protein